MMKKFLILLIFALSLNCHPFANLKFVTAQSMGASFNSNPLPLDQISSTNIHCIYTGTPSGTLVLQASNDDVPKTQIANWTDISGSSVAIAAAGDTMYNNPYSIYKWIRVKYTRTASTGSMDCYYMGK